MSRKWVPAEGLLNSVLDWLTRYWEEHRHGATAWDIERAFGLSGEQTKRVIDRLHEAGLIGDVPPDRE